MRKGISEDKVKRMRNIVSGNYNSKTKIRSGYTAKNIERVEGDVWEERGKTWTIKNGIKQTVNKLDSFRKENALPLCCPKCNKQMKPWRDAHAYSHFNFCNNCLAIYEAKLKISGNWEEYKTKVQDANYDSWLEEEYQKFHDFLNSRKSKSMISEAGDIEDWEGGLTDEQLKENFKNYIKNIRDKIDEYRQK